MMDIVKKNLLSIVCGVIAIAAIVASFLPLGGLFLGLEEQVDQSMKDYTTINQMNNLVVNWPLVDPRTSQPTPLEGFPTKAAIEQGEKAVDGIKGQADRMMEVAWAMNKRELLVSGSFPQRTGPTASQFKADYFYRIEQLKKLMNATSLPTQEEEEEAKKQIKKEWEARIAVVGDREINRTEIQEKITQLEATLGARMRKERAEKFAMYVSSQDRGFDIHPRVLPPEKDPTLPDIVDMWAAQIGMWLQEDVCVAIADTNKEFSDPKKPGVAGSAIKRLVRVEFPRLYITAKGPVPIEPVGTLGSFSQGSFLTPTVDDPNALPAPENQKSYTYTPTGRVCNDVYDVVHFTVVIDANAAIYNQFVTRLLNNRLLTVIRADLYGLDRDKAQSAGYFYGDQPVAQVTLQCEAIFFREWVNPKTNRKEGFLQWMPQPVQKLLNVPQANPTVAVN